MPRRCRSALESAFGRELREAREAVAISQEEAAARAGITQTYWSQVEAGKRSPTIGVADRMARAVETSLSALFARGGR